MGRASTRYALVGGEADQRRLGTHPSRRCSHVYALPPKNSSCKRLEGGVIVGAQSQTS
jgi:hypothetical protein